MGAFEEVGAKVAGGLSVDVISGLIIKKTPEVFLGTLDLNRTGELSISEKAQIDGGIRAAIVAVLMVGTILERETTVAEEAGVVGVVVGVAARGTKGKTK